MVTRRHFISAITAALGGTTFAASGKPRAIVLRSAYDTVTVVCHEPHSPIIALANRTPIIHRYSEFHSPKCWMFKDIGLGDWLLEMDETPVEKMAETLFAIDADYPAAQAKVEKAMAYVLECVAGSMVQVKSVLGA